MGLLDEAKEEFLLLDEEPRLFSDSCLMIAVCLKEKGECQSASAQLELLLKDPKCQEPRRKPFAMNSAYSTKPKNSGVRLPAMYESIPTFHDVPQRLESARAHRAPAEPTPRSAYGN